MLVNRGEPDSAGRRLRELLLDYLQAATVSAWPGTDGLTEEDVLDGYAQAVAAGEVPDWRQLLRRHPELAAELQDWMAAKDRWTFACRPGHGGSAPGLVEPRALSDDPNGASPRKETTS